jgi:hypothetical protein
VVHVTNLASDGKTSDVLLTQVRSDPATRQALRDARAVLLGIGGADLNRATKTRWRAGARAAPAIRRPAGWQSRPRGGRYKPHHPKLETVARGENTPPGMICAQPAPAADLAEQRSYSAICLRPAGVRTGSRVTHSKRGPIAGERTCLRAHKQAPARATGVSRVCRLVRPPPLLLIIQPRAPAAVRTSPSYLVYPIRTL